MTDRDVLYAAVRAAPDDDTPRLAFADYLDDTGSRADAIRARFIRNQVALARAEPWSAEWEQLYRATAPVEAHYAKAWAAGVEGLVIPEGHVYRRGFLDQVTCYAKRFVADGAALVAAHPIRGVKFAAMNAARGAATGPELAACPHLARVNSVHLTGALVNDAFVAAVGASPHAAGIATVRLERAPIGARTLARLGGDYFPALGELDVTLTALGTDGAETLAGAGQLGGLRSLRIGRAMDEPGTPVRGPGAVELALAPHLRGLVELDLHRQELRQRGAVAFFQAYAWPGLKRLWLRGNGIPPVALAALAANPHARSLTLLDLRSNDITAVHLGPLREACPNARVLTDDTDHPIRLVLQPEDEP